MRKFIISLVALLLVAGVTLLGAPEQTARAAQTFVVTTTLDTIDANSADNICADSAGLCSLRAAVMQANATAGLDFIEIPAGEYVLTRSGTGEDQGQTGDLDITDSVLINGAGNSNTVINANGIDRAFHIVNSGARLSDLTVTGGDASITGANGGGVYGDNANGLELISTVFIDNRANFGGAVRLEQNIDGPGGSFFIRKSTFTNNTADRFGGGVSVNRTNGATFTIEESTFEGNTAGENGGVSNFLRTIIIVEDSTFDGNSAFGVNNSSGLGGAFVFDTDSSGTIYRSTFSNNTAVSGGALAVFQSQLTLVNSTISGNTASLKGGGIHGQESLDTSLLGTVEVINSLVFDNTATSTETDEGGDGIFVDDRTVFELDNTIVVGTAADECRVIQQDVDNPGVLTVDGNNLFSSGSGCPAGTSDIVSGLALSSIVDPTLQYNGGLTQTHALVSGSPAINQGNTTVCGDTFVDGEDQRTAPRDVNCDIGPFEFGAPAPPSPPTDLVVTLAVAGVNGEIDLTWTDNTPGETSFQIERSTDGSNWSLYDSVAANTITYTDTNIDCNLTYYYRIIAFRSGDSASSAPSNVDSVTNVCNLLYNFSFEDPLGDMFSNWGLISTGDAIGDRRECSFPQAAITGTCLMVIKGGTDGRVDGFRQFLEISDVPFSGQAGQRYRFSFWLRAIDLDPGATIVGGRVLVKDTTLQNRQLVNCFTDLRGTFKYVQLVCEFEAKFAFDRLRVDAGAVEADFGFAGFEDFVLYELP